MTLATPLAGLTVLDLTTVVAGPIASLTLAQQGANVIKVEPPGGDLVRRLGYIAKDGSSSTFQTLNRGKSLISLDLTDADAQAALQTLIGQADVVMHNYRPAAAQKLKLDARTLRRSHPDLIVAEVTGFGPWDPLSDVRAYDPVIQAESGLAARPDKPEPELYPQYICDKVAGLYLCQAITSALVGRERDGQGRNVAVSMLEAALAFSWMDVHMPLTLKAPLQPGPNIAKVYRPWKAADGWFVVVMLSEKEFSAWCDTVGARQLLDDPRCADMASRFKNWDFIRETCAPLAEDQPVDALLERLRKAGVPAGKVNSSDDILTHPQLAASGFIYEGEADGPGPVRLPGAAARFDGQRPGQGATCSGRLGADTRMILEKAGVDNALITRICGDGA
ncbi:CoA transferase [Oceanicaulis alexandrii]|uniref:CaiB/BaiF CoA transferase family protein n=1 Tax=Oceanicaulis alexandrii TaxID=153233 RepID=UPI0035CEF078